ncbi:MAG: sigma-70 family RNA polymerase sigma factor [Verrucomicrobiae bacterium]|nr:sigma-70 family RNA polymerase sigma factor [Verrucomicrobiae bacterium]
MPEDDHALLHAYTKTGSHAAFRALLERYAGMVMAGARRRTGDDLLAEEVAQGVFITLARKAKSLQKHPSLRAWLHTTTRLQSLSVMRAERRHRRKQLALMKQPESATEPVLDERLPLLDEALDELDESDRRIVLLRFVDEADYAEIGRRLGKTEAACRKQVSRAMKKLGRFLQAKGCTVSTLAICTALGAQLGKATAAGFGGTLAQAALANLSNIPTSSLILNTLETMTYGKTKAFVAATVLATIPLSLQWREMGSLRREIAALRATATTPSSPSLLESPENLTSKPTADIHPSLETATQTRRPGDLPAVPGLLGEGLVFPLPFEDVASLGLVAVSEDGQLSDQVIRLLRMTPSEVADINQALTEARKRVWALEKQQVTAVKVTDEEQVYKISAFPEAGEEVQQSLTDTFSRVLGGERSEFLSSRFVRGLDSRRKYGLFGERHRTISFKPEDEGRVFVSITELNEDGTRSQSYSNAYDTIPEEYAHLFRSEAIEE